VGSRHTETRGPSGTPAAGPTSRTRSTDDSRHAPSVVTSGPDDAIVAPGTPGPPRTSQLGEIVRDELIASKTSSGCLLRLRSGAAPLRGIDGRRLRPSRPRERHIPVDALVHERLALLRPHGAATGKPAHSLPAEVRGPRSVRTGDASRRGGVGQESFIGQAHDRGPGDTKQRGSLAQRHHVRAGSRGCPAEERVPAQVKPRARSDRRAPRALCVTRSLPAITGATPVAEGDRLAKFANAMSRLSSD
jgi:hypothetical protein